MDARRIFVLTLLFAAVPVGTTPIAAQRGLVMRMEAAADGRALAALAHSHF